MGHVVREIAWCTIDIDTRMGRVFLQERWQYIWKVQPRRPTAEPSLPNHLGRDEQDDPGYQVLGQEPLMHHLQFYRTLSLAFVLAIAYSHEASAEGSRESAVPVAVSTRTPQEQSKLTDRSSSVDAEEAARFDWSGDSCDTVSRLPKLLGLGVAELERRVGPPDHKESFRLGERQHEFHIALMESLELDANISPMHLQHQPKWGTSPTTDLVRENYESRESARIDSRRFARFVVSSFGVSQRSSSWVLVGLKRSLVGSCSHLTSTDCFHMPTRIQPSSPTGDILYGT